MCSDMVRLILIWNRVSIEAGGNSAFIVFDDANLETAVNSKSCLKIPSPNRLTPTHSYFFGQIHYHRPNMCEP